MRIGIFTNNYHPMIGGLTTAIDTYFNELTKRNHDVFIFAPRFPGYEDSSENIFRYKSIGAPTYSDFVLGIPYSPRISKIVRKINLDIIHSQHPFLIGKAGLKFSRILKIPLIFTYHTLYEKYSHYIPFHQGIVKKLAINLSVSFSNKADLVIAPTDEIKQLLISYHVESPIEVVPTGVDLDVFFKKFDESNLERMRKKLNISTGNPVLLYVGRLDKEKNLYFLLDVIKRIINYEPNVRVLIVGKGMEQDALIKYSESLGIDKNMVFTGGINRDEIADYYLFADIFIFSSMTETQGLVVTEAMAAGKPAVALNAYGVRNLIKNNVTGFLVENSVEIFTDKVLELIRDREKCDRFGEAARLEAEKYSSSKQVDKLIQLYEEVIKSNARKKI